MADDRRTADADGDAWVSLRQDAPLSVIWPLLGRHIAFHRRLVDLTANVKAALLLSQSIYWTRHGRDVARNGGWFLKTAEQWEMETGLSAKEQAGARDVLRRLGVLVERRLGAPGRLHFRVNVERLGARLAQRIGRDVGRFDWSDVAVMAELLGPSLAFHRTLAGIGGGVHAGLMLSRALHLTRLQRQRRLDAWVCNSVARWSEDLGLSRREQETARRDLARTGVWDEALRGIPRSLVARIRLDCLLSLLTEWGGETLSVAGRSIPPAGGLSSDRSSQNGDSSLWQPRNLGSPKPPNHIRPIRRATFAESASLHIQGSTSDSVQPHNPTLQPHERREPDGSSSGGALVFPEQLLPEERAAARLLLRHCGDDGQALLDELSARLRAGNVRSSPIAYLRGLVSRAAAGSFVPELGHRIAAERAHRQREAVRREQREAEEQRLAAERATPEYKAKVRTHREQIRRLLDDMRSGRRPGEPT